jgi:hypothetical protein
MKLVLLSDLHILSRYALVPPDWRLPKDPLAPIQDYLWRCWEHFVSRLPLVDAVVINGEITEGETPTSRSAREAVTDDLVLQGQAALEALRPLRAKTRALYITRGTPFHEGKHFETIETVARALEATPIGLGSVSATEAVIRLDGLALHVSHHMPTGFVWTASGAHRAAVMWRLAESLGRVPPGVQLLVRGHIHEMVLLHAAGLWVVVTPAWKVVTPYAERRMEAARAHAKSDVGGLLVEVLDGRITWTPLTYPLTLAPADAAGGRDAPGRARSRPARPRRSRQGLGRRR